MLFITSFSLDNYRTGTKADEKRTHNGVFEIVDTESRTIERFYTKKKDEIERYLSLPKIEDAIAQGVVSQEEYDSIILDVWKRKMCSEYTSWRKDIDFYVFNVSFDNFLMVPVNYKERRKEYQGTLVKFHDVYVEGKNRIYSRKKASILLDTGEIKEIESSNVLKITDDAMDILRTNYLALIVNATTPNVDVSSIFPYEPLEGIEEKMNGHEMAMEKAEKDRSDSLLYKMRLGLVDNLQRKGFAGTDSERESIIHKMMLSYFGRDVNH